MNNKINLPNGHELVLNDMKYKIKNFLGHGGSSIVYRAMSNEGPVIIKELFPHDLKNKITRKNFDNKDMTLVIPHECDEKMKMYAERAKFEFEFVQQLRNTENTTARPEIAHYKALVEENNTIYIVIGDSYDGETLDEMMSSKINDNNFKSFEDMCEQILRILEALKPIHNHPDGAYLHIDIKPDNIFVLKRMIGGRRITNLIDFNSVYKMGTIEKRDRAFSQDEDYSAPELKALRGTSDPAAKELIEAVDLYSVVAIFFKLLMGRPHNTEDRGAWSRGENIFLNPNNPCKYIDTLFSRTIKKLNEVLKKGLRYSKVTRYTTIVDLWADINSLIEDADIKKKYALRIKQQLGKITDWKEGNSKIYELLYDNDVYIPMMAKETDNEVAYNLDKLLSQLEANGYRHAVLTGDGGMGKTTTSLRVLENCLTEHEQAVYIPLSEYSPVKSLEDAIKESFGIRGNNDTALTHKDYVDLITDDEIVLILDGYNEISDYKGKIDGKPVECLKYNNERALLDEIKELVEKKYIRIIITSRSSINVFPLNLDSFAKLEFEKITSEYIVKWLSAYLPEDNIDSNKINLPFDVLGVPMLLKMYAIDIGLQRDLAGEDDDGFLDNPTTAGEILWNYFEHQIRKSIKLYEKTDNAKGSEKVLFKDFSRILFKHLLPYIAYRIEKEQEQDKLSFTITELKGFLKDYRKLFESYRDLSDDLSALEIAFDTFLADAYSHKLLTKPCCDVYGILENVNNTDKKFSFNHQYFRDFFSAYHIRNQMKLNDKEVFTERIFPFHISRMLLEILQEHKYVPPGRE